MSFTALLWEGAQCSKDGAHSFPYYCMRCDEMFCRNCWHKIKKHRRKEPGHYKIIPDDAIVVHSILKGRLDDCLLLNDAIKRSPAPHLRQIDGNSEWFGVRHNNEAGDCSLIESLAYDLLVDSFETPTSDTYPVLVSFVGATGSGKSTLINLLSKFSGPLPANRFKTPAVGDSGSLQPTSSNVHLYADPQTFRTQSPILYAECEGMDGYEIPPETKKPLAGALASIDPLLHTQIPELDSHDIIWSKTSMNADAWTRKEITGILFPRILYIFSDVVVFPFSRIRVDDTLFQLVKWGHSAMMQSYNKPDLPSAIIVFIDQDDQVDPYEYDLSTATEWFFKQLCPPDISKNKTLQPYIQYWETNGHRIVSAKDLLSCYYTSVSVVHLSSGQHPTPMHQEIKTLYGRISRVCPEPEIGQDLVQWKWNAATLPLFVRKAFTHFASKYETPFNFSDAWVDLQSFSPDFNWSIFNLARMARQHRDLSRTGMDLWASIGGFVASCLFLNRARAKHDCIITGEAWMQCDAAVAQYWIRFWPCSYRIQTTAGSQQCVNAPSGHPHHQCGKAVEKGNHFAKCSLGKAQREFRGLVAKAFSEIKYRLKHLSDSHERLKGASTIHLGRTKLFCQLNGGIDKLVSHLPCLVCLDGVPEHSLPCGHVICRECAKAAGDSTPRGFVTLRGCPLQNHRKEDWPRGRTRD